MTPRLRIQVEGRLEFEFDKAQWNAIKWDDDNAYRDGLARADGAKAVDILATFARSTTYLIEVKDPRGHSIEYRTATSTDQLAKLVAAKVRDTIAGLIYACDRVAETEHVLVHLKNLVQRGSSKPWVILWLEDNEADPTRATTLKGRIEAHLCWLKPKVMVTSRKLWKALPGVSVRSLDGVPWAGLAAPMLRSDAERPPRSPKDNLYNNYKYL